MYLLLKFSLHFDSFPASGFSFEQTDLVKRVLRYALEALSFWARMDCLTNFNFLDQEYFLGLLTVSVTNPLHSVDHSKKYSSGFSSQLTRQDSIGEMLHDSNGVLAVVAAVVVEFLRRFWTIWRRGGRWSGRSFPL